MLGADVRAGLDSASGPSRNNLRVNSLFFYVPNATFRDIYSNIVSSRAANAFDKVSATYPFLHHPETQCGPSYAYSMPPARVAGGFDSIPIISNGINAAGGLPHPSAHSVCVRVVRKLSKQFNIG